MSSPPHRDPAPPGPAAESTDALPAGTRLDGFQIEGVIASSGFSIVYQARDLSLESSVALKEYLPSAIARRDEHRVVARSAPQAHAFEQGKRAFMQEAQMLARCDHPALLRVSRLWQSHGTAYRAMPLYAGRTLLAMRHAMSTPPDEAWLRTLIDDLLGALETVHDAGFVHRRVLPANILVRPNGRPVLMDFDAVRHTLMSDKAQSLMAALDPNSVDGTAHEPDLPQTAASDLHALAATVHFCVTGQPPSLAWGPDAPRDSLEHVLARLNAAGPTLEYGRSFVHAIDRALHPDAAQWPQSVADFRDWLKAPSVAAPAPAPAPAPARQASAVPQPEPASAAPPEGLLRKPAAAGAAASVAQESAAPSPTSPKKADDESGSEFFPGFGQRTGIDGQAPPRPRPRDAARKPRPAPQSRFEPSQLSSRFGSDFGESALGGPSVMGDARRPKASPPRARPSKLLPWGVAAGVVGLALVAIWKMQDTQQYDRLLVELAKTAPPPQFGSAASSPDGAAAVPAPADTASASLAAAASPQPATVAAQAGNALPASPSAAASALASSQAAMAAASSPLVLQNSRAVAEVSLPTEPTSAGPTRAATPTPEAPVEATAPVPEKRRARTQPSAAAAAAGPRDACGTRTQFSLYRCMETQCARARWVKHPACLRFKSCDALGA